MSEPRICPPPPSGADFYLPKRGAAALDAAQVRIKQLPPPSEQTDDQPEEGAQ